MRYPVAIERGGSETAFGVVVPDLPGCFSAGDTFDEALRNAEEAIELHIEHLLDAGEEVPQPSDPVEAMARPEFAGWLWAVVKIDPAVLDERVERVNISLPRRILHAIDRAAEQVGETRSAFLATAALERSSRQRV